MSNDTTYNPARKYAELDRLQAAQLAQAAGAVPPPAASPTPPASFEMPPVAGVPAAVVPPLASPPAAATSAPAPPLPAPSLAPPPPPPPVVSGPSAAELELVRIQMELAKEREAHAALQAERDRLAAAQEQSAKALAEAAQARAAATAQQLLNPSAWDLKHLDEDELVKVLQPVVTNFAAEQEATRKQLAEAQAQQAAMQAEWQKQLAQHQAALTRERTNQELLAAVPDWQALMLDPTFQAYVQQPVKPGAGVTIWQMMEHNYKQGNAAYVASEVAAFRGAAQPAPVAQVAPAVAGTVPAMPSPPPKSSPDDAELEALRRGVRTGTVDQKTFAEAWKRHQQQGMDTKPVLQ